VDHREPDGESGTGPSVWELVVILAIGIGTVFGAFYAFGAQASHILMKVSGSV
jgi:hypothetical protein